LKLSFNWLGDFVDLSGLTPQEVADRLTMGAFEVEEVVSFGPDIQGPLVVGEILEINPHPNADKIRLTKIRLAEGGQPQEIVCGAWNIEVGNKIPVALPGARVINRHDGSPLAIKESKIRGVASHGMLCSSPELGIIGESEGIIILSPETKVGLDAKEVLGLKNDYILHVEPRSNRGDALCVLGLAREVSALFGRPLKQPAWEEEFAAMQADAAPLSIDVEIEDTDDCPYFTVRTLAGIRIGPACPLVRGRLEAIGIKSVNNVVDITNYVLHELGQPLHAYDLKLLKGNKLAVRRARADEILTTLDLKERKLSGEVLVIADAESVVGVAGVMGGKLSEVSETTTTIALEAASFAPARVRRSSRLLGLTSDSSLRFERGVDTAQVNRSSDRASYLLVKYAGARPGRMAGAGCPSLPPRKLRLRMSELKRICEIEMTPETAAKMLVPLGFAGESSPDDRTAPAVTFEVPSFRQKDVYREIDLIEEITRLHGYEKLPVSMPPATIAAGVTDTLSARIAWALRANGLSEAWISSLTSRDDLDGRQSFTSRSDDAVFVQNPLSTEHQMLRQTLVPGLLKAASFNQDRGNANPCLFELGKIYRRDARRVNKQLPATRQTLTHEELMAAAIVCGQPALGQWLESEKQDDAFSYYVVKGVLENLVSSLNIPPSALRYERTDNIPGWFHPGRSAACFVDMADLQRLSDRGSNKKQEALKPVFLAYLGQIHPAVADAYRLSGRAAALEMSIAAISAVMTSPVYAEIYLTPVIQRDLTCDLENLVNHQDVERCIAACGEDTLQKVVLVSVFKLSPTHKSLSYRLTFQHPNQTLTADAVDAVMAKIRDDLTGKLNAGFRL
jgi:phenylalanyl-tRNA synthetase beta chain